MLPAAGSTTELARTVAVQLSRDPETALRLHIVAELGLNPEDKPSPRVAAVSSFLTFAIGALIPLLPYLFGVSVLVGGAGLRRRRAVRRPARCRPGSPRGRGGTAALRQLLFGAVAAGDHLPGRHGDRRRGLRRGRA